MGEGNQESVAQDALDDLFEPIIGDINDELIQNANPISTEKQRLVEKRRLAEQRLEEKRLRDELGDYDFQFDD